MAKRSYLFELFDDRLTTPLLTMAGDFTITCHYQPALLLGTPTIFGRQDSTADWWIFRLNETPDDVQIRINGAGNAYNIALIAGDLTANWAHWAARRIGTDLSIFRNGIVDGSATVVTDDLEIDQIGMSNGTRQLNGKLFDCRAYAAGLTTEEIVSVMGGGQVAKPLMRWYRCDDVHPTLALDSSIFRQHGTKVDITPSTFHYSAADVPFDYHPTLYRQQQLIVPTER